MSNEFIADGHTHLFNAGFLPIEGVLMSRGVRKELAEGVADFIEKEIERDAPDTPLSALPPRLRSRSKLYDMLENELSRDEPDDDSRESDLIKAVVDLIPDDDLAELHETLKRFRREPQGNPDEREGVRSEIDNDRVTLERMLREADAKAGPVETGEDSAPAIALSIRSLVKWLLLLLIHESRIERAYSKAWDGNHSITLRVHLMMDMENHYRSKRVLYLLPERHRRMQALAEPGLLGFTAFDPFREECQTIIEDAIRSGFTGVKFYPPNGYRPIGNLAGEIKDGPPPEVVDSRNLKLFRFCVRADKDVPIFTHCSNGGMESRQHDTGKFADPCGWRKVLEIDGLASLRLCLGHAGGQPGWFAKSTADFESSYAGEVFRLCTKYDNVYCDFGYFDRILNTSDGKLFAERLAAAIEAKPKFATRCCFGTDWHMLAQVKSRKYVARFNDLMRSTGLEQYREQIMGANLVTYLKNPTLGAKVT